MSGLQGGAIPIRDANLARLTDDELETLKRIAQKLADPADDSGGRQRALKKAILHRNYVHLAITRRRPNHPYGEWPKRMSA